MAADDRTLAAIISTGSGSYEVYRYTQSGGSWQDEHLLAGAFDGDGVGRIDVSGELIAHARVGGSVEIFEGDAVETILASDVDLAPTLGPPGTFGADIGISDGGPPRVVVGAPTTENNGEFSAGAVYVFQRFARGRGRDNVWVAEAALGGTAAGQLLGRLVAVSGRHVIAATLQQQVVFWDTTGSPAYHNLQLLGIIRDVDIRGRVAAVAVGERAVVFERDDSGAWQESFWAQLPQGSDVESVAIRGGLVLVGGNGHVALYDLSGSLVGVAASPDNRTAFGKGVALSAGAALVSKPGASWIRVFDTAGACDAMVATPDRLLFPPSSGSQQIALDVSPEGCAWNVRFRRHGWTVSPDAGVGDAVIDITVPDRTLPLPETRRLRLSAGGRVRVRQLGAGATNCSRVLLNHYEATVAASGGPVAIGVRADPNTCEWHVVSDEDWLSTSSTSGTGDQEITVVVEPHTGSAPRMGTVIIGSRVYTVNQTAPGAAIECGAELLVDTALESDVDCTGLGVDGVGLRLGDGVTLDLNGHTVRGPGTDVNGASAIFLEGTEATITNSGAFGASFFDFQFGIVAIETGSLPCPTLSSLIDGSCEPSDELVSRASRPKARLTVEGVVFQRTFFGVLGVASDITVDRSLFAESFQGVAHMGATASAPSPNLLLRYNDFLANAVGVYVEGAAVRLIQNEFVGNAGAGAYLNDTQFTEVIGNTFDSNNAQTNDGEFLGQLTLVPSSSMILVQCNTFIDVPHEGATSFDLDGPGSPAPGHGGIGIEEEIAGTEIDVLENTFVSGDAAIFFYETGDAQYRIENNNFRAGLTFNIGMHDGFVSSRQLTGSGNYVENGAPIITDPGAGLEIPDVNANGTTTNTCSFVGR